MTLAFMLLGCLPLDPGLFLPEPMAVRLRLASLKPGMDKNEVLKALRLGSRFPDNSFSLRGSSDRYAIGRDHVLHLRYQYDRDKIVLERAEWYRGQKLLVRVGAAPPAAKGVDPKLIEAAVQAFQGRSSLMPRLDGSETDGELRRFLKLLRPRR